MTTFRRTNIVGVQEHNFESGNAIIAVGALLESRTCGCFVEFGVRLDSDETVILSHPCQRYLPNWTHVEAGLLNDKVGLDTEVLLGTLLSELDANEAV